jgi:hypothetical protein
VSTVSKDAGRELDRAIERDLHAVPEPVRIAFVLGIDPGAGATGITLLELAWETGKLGARSFACNAGAAEWLLRAILDDTEDRCGPGEIRGGIEAFAPGNGAGARMKTGQVTRDLVEDLAGVCSEYGVPLTARFASVAKTWGTDARLRKAGLYDLTGKSPDMRDSSRHALMESVQNCGWPDPISRKAAPG